MIGSVFLELTIDLFYSCLIATEETLGYLQKKASLN